MKQDRIGRLGKIEYREWNRQLTLWSEILPRKKVSKAALFVDNYKYLIIVLYNYAPAQGALSDDAVWRLTSDVCRVYRA